MARKRVTTEGPPPGQPTLEQCPVCPDEVCGICGAELRVTPSGKCCPAHGGAPPTKPKRSAVMQQLREQKENAAKAAAFDFESAQPGEEPARHPVDPRMASIVETTFAPIGWDEVFSEYDAWMELGDRRAEEAFIRLAHEKGPAVVKRLFLVYTQVRDAREDWEKRNEHELGGMRESANELLQAEKNAGARSKTITNEDIDKKVAVMFPDAWPRQERERRRYRLVEDRAKHDVEVAKLRVRVLGQMMDSLR